MKTIFNITYKLLAVIALPFLLLSSCSDFLYQEPDTQISIEEQFSTEEGLIQAVNGMYYNIEALVSGKYFVYADMLGGNITFAPKSSGELEVPASIEFSFDYDDQEDESDFSSTYKNAYDVINQANMILEHLYDVEDMAEQKRQQIKAEALTIRGFTHFIVSQLYSQNMNYSADGDHPGIVYVTRVLQAGVDYPSRETKQNTYHLIKNDLEEALSLFTGEQVFDFGPDYSYFNGTNTRALLAKVALDNNDWQTAYAAADSVLTVSANIFVAKDDYVAAWKDISTIPEALIEFSAPVTSELEVSSSVSNSYYYYTLNSDIAGVVKSFTYKTQAYVASLDLRNSFEADDIRKDLFYPLHIPVLADDIYWDSTFYFTEKFQNDAGTLYMRLSEMYLIRSEAAYWLNNEDPSSSIADLNMTRERAGLSPLQSLTSEEYLEELYWERRRELAFEGHLFFDHMRLQRDVTRGDDAYGASQLLRYPNNKFVLPLPESTLEVNEYLEQNEGYY